MIRKIAVSFAFFLMAIGLLAPSALASVTFDPATGTGFVGKGDVQQAFGWNNPALQANAGGVTFTYDATETYSAVCTWTTGEGTRGEKIHNVSHKQRTSVSSSVGYDARTMKQITGFNLLGLGATSTEDTIPVVGGACPGNPGHDGTWSSVELISSTGGLYVNYGGASVLLQ